MPKAHSHTAAELLTILSARQLSDGQVVFAGVGIPLLAATLAQRLRCPGLTILFEGGVIGAFIEPGKLPPSTNDQRCTKRANMVLGSAEVLLLLQRGYVDVGFMGGAQIDPESLATLSRQFNRVERRAGRWLQHIGLVGVPFASSSRFHNLRPTTSRARVGWSCRVSSLVGSSVAGKVEEEISAAHYSSRAEEPRCRNRPGRAERWPARPRKLCEISS